MYVEMFCAEGCADGKEMAILVTSDISFCERMVMKVIWDSPEELALQEIMGRVNLENGKEWKPQTVSTFLSRLLKKEFISSYRKSRYTYYQPLVSKMDYWKQTMIENAQYFTKGDMGEMVCMMCRELLTKEDLEKIKKGIAECG